MKTGLVKVIVSRCVKENGAYRLVASRFFDEEFSSIEEAKPIAESKIAQGMSVILRPMYNEEDEKGTFFREYRSFDGNPLAEVIFRV